MSSACRFYSTHRLGYFVISHTNIILGIAQSAFLKKHRIPSRSLIQSFSGKSAKISDCRAFSPFKTFPAAGHLDTGNFFSLDALDQAYRAQIMSGFSFTRLSTSLLASIPKLDQLSSLSLKREIACHHYQM